MDIVRFFFKSRRHKNSKFAYYVRSVIYQLIPSCLFRIRLKGLLNQSKRFDVAAINFRVNYYNKLSSSTFNPEILPPLSEFKIPPKARVYYFDLYEYTCYFSKKLRMRSLPGDITHIPSLPSIVKSRPIAGDNANSVLMKLDKVRHFVFVKDKRRYEDKKDMLVGRGYYTQIHRQRFVEMYKNHPLCDVGSINLVTGHPEWTVPKISIDEHLNYKFILSLEGNDVATNLKWIMSSNSIAVCPKHKYETWFMEGTLIPNYHYILIKDDYSDLEERLSYYLKHPDEAKKIITNANEYVKQFKFNKLENQLSLMVLDKYFKKTNQLHECRS